MFAPSLSLLPAVVAVVDPLFSSDKSGGYCKVHQCRHIQPDLKLWHTAKYRVLPGVNRLNQQCANLHGSEGLNVTDVHLYVKVLNSSFKMKNQ